MAEVAHPPINWDALLKRLVAKAIDLFAKQGCRREKDSVLPATGQSAVDLAYEAMWQFLEEYADKAYKLSDGERFALIKQIMVHNFIDLVKGAEYKQTVVMDAVRTEETGEENKKQPVLEDMPDQSDKEKTEFYDLNSELVGRRVYPYIKDEPELKDYVDVVLKGGFLKRDDIAIMLGVDVKEITRRRERLKNRLAPWKKSLPPKTGEKLIYEEE